MLNKEDAIRVEKIQYGRNTRNGKLRSQLVYIYRCQCGNEIRSQQSYLKSHSGKCVKCAQYNEPFRAVYNELCKASKRRAINITLTYKDFLEFTTISKCHYCFTYIEWHPHTKNNNKEIKGSRAYKLDRTDNSLGYTKENCVVCCRRCNEGKSNKFSYEEWLGMTRYLRDHVGGVCGV